MPHAIGPGGVHIHYRVFGERGPFIVLVQGLGLSSAFWFELPDTLSRDRRGEARVIVLDNRGVGESDAPRGRYRMTDMADDVIAVMDAVGAETATIVGISMGGMIAQHVALRHPSRVDGLVLLATTAGLPHGRLPAPASIAMLLSLPLGGRRAARNLAKLILPRSQLPRARELLAEWGPLLMRHPITLHGWFGQLTAVLGHSTGFRLKNVRCPTVVVTGDDDILVPPRNAHVIAARIPGAHLEVLPDTGHGVPVLHRDVVERALERVRARAHAA